MSYATIDDVIALYGLGEVDAALGRHRDVPVDADAVAIFDTALDAASSEIDTFLADRYAVPLVPAPPAIRTMAIDLAIHRVALRSAVLREEWKERAETVRAQLRDLAKGIGAVPGLAPPNDEPGAPAPADVQVAGRDRRFPRSGGLL